MIPYHLHREGRENQRDSGQGSGQKRICGIFSSVQVSRDEWVLAGVKGGEDILERGRGVSQNTEILTAWAQNSAGCHPQLAS